MVSESQMRSEIQNRVMSAEKKDYSIWTIGVTDDPDRRKEEHGQEHSVKYWVQWRSDSETAARNVEEYFLDKGMKGGTGGGGTADYVYIF